MEILNSPELTNLLIVLASATAAADARTINKLINSGEFNISI